MSKSENLPRQGGKNPAVLRLINLVRPENPPRQGDKAPPILRLIERLSEAERRELFAHLEWRRDLTPGFFVLADVVMECVSNLVEIRGDALAWTVGKLSRRNPTTLEKLEEAERLRAQGVSWAEAARKVGWSYDQLKKARTRYPPSDRPAQPNRDT